MNSTNNDSKAPIQFYRCMGCGHNGDYGTLKTRSQRCDSCGSADYLLKLNKTEHASRVSAGLRADKTCPLVDLRAKQVEALKPKQVEGLGVEEVPSVKS